MHRWAFGCSVAVVGMIGCGGSSTGTTTTPPPPPLVVATPAMSPAPGTFSTGQSVTLSDATSGATIYYTTDGATPTASSSTYTAAIPFTADTTIKAIAVASGYSMSGVAQGSYLVAGPAVGVVMSTHDQTQLMASQTATLFTDTTAGTNNIVVDEGQVYQTIEGFVRHLLTPRLTYLNK